MTGAAARGLRGFTILHVTVLLGVLTTAASFGIPQWFGRPEVTLDSAAVLLAQDLREVQNRAAFQRRALHIVFLDDGRGYEARDEHGATIAATLGGGPFRRTYSHDAVFRGVTIADGARSEVHFGSRGELLDDARLVLVFDGHERVLRAIAPSGHVEIDGLEREWVDDLD